MEQNGPPRALVVSNDHRFLSLIRNVLAEIGLEMCTVEGWDAVIEHAERAQPEIIFLDLNATHGSACAQALRELRAYAGTCKVPSWFARRPPGSSTSMPSIFGSPARGCGRRHLTRPNCCSP